jgi:PAS domain S-box-containing protein
VTESGLVVGVRVGPIWIEAALVTLGAALVLLALAYRRLLRPIRELRVAMQRAAEGDLSGNVVLPHAEPLEPLAREFNRMLERVRSTQNELEATNRNLESIVEERTRDMRRSERKYRSLVGQASVGILLWDPVDLRIRETNAKAAELLGERPRDLLRRSVGDLFVEPLRPHAVRALRRVTEVGTLRLAETLLERRDQGSLPVQVGASLVRLGDETIVLGILQDLSEKKELERRAALSTELILRNEKMASIGQLAAGVAHEINNPMGYVASNINRLVEYTKTLERLVERSTTSSEPSVPLAEIDELVCEIEEIAQDASEGVARVTEIVRALREFSHGGESAGSLRWADLGDVVRNCLTLVRNEVKGRARIELQLEPLPPVLCHPMQIAQVVLNLIRNAVQSMDEFGTIQIATHDSGDRVHISIEDDGRGIPPEHLDRVFEPFFTTKEVGQGTGLGLAVSREMVRSHDGEIWVESAVGIGTRFVVELNRDGPRSAAEWKPQEPA